MHIATPEAVQLTYKYPSLLNANSGMLCADAPNKFLTSLLIGSCLPQICELAHKHGVSPSPKVLRPYVFEHVPRFQVEGQAFEGSDAVSKYACGVPATILIEGPYAGLMLVNHFQNILPSAAHFWNSQLLSQLWYPEIPPTTWDGMAVHTSEPDCVPFHNAYTMLVRQNFNRLRGLGGTTSDAFCAMIEQLGFSRPSFNRTIDGSIF